MKAVDNVSFSIKQGEFFSLLGPSGCGKTTLLRLLAGFESANQGEIFIDGIDVTTMPPNLRPTNMVFQNYAIFPHINVKKNIEFGMRREKLSKQDLDNRVEEVLSLVKLEGYEERFSNPFVAAEKGYIDDVIMPRSTRKRLVRAFKGLEGKKQINPWKKHDNIPL